MRFVPLFILAALLPACSSRPHPTEASAPSDLTRPAVEHAGLGLEVRGWLVDNRDHRLASAFAAAEAADALGSADALWASCGLRVLEVPVADLPALFGRLAVGPEQRLWLGQSPRWTEAYAAAESSGRTAIQMPDGPLELQPGTLRLLSRAWVERRVVWNAPDIGQAAPAASASAGIRTSLRVDLVPQNRERAATDLTLTPVDPTRPLDTGLVFDRLRTSWTSDGSRALILVPADPGEDWQALSASMGPVHEDPAVFGPAGPSRSTLGHALLGTPRDGFRIVLILIPRTSIER